MVDYLWILLWMLSCIHLVVSFSTCDMDKYILPAEHRCNPSGGQFSDEKPGFTSIYDPSLKCSDQCYCHLVVGFQYVKDNCSLHLFRQSVAYTGAVLQYWDEPTLNLDDLHMYQHSTLALEFQQPIPKILATKSDGWYGLVGGTYGPLPEFYLMLSTRAPYQLDSETKDNLRKVFSVSEYDCLPDDRTYRCTVVVGDVVLTEKDDVFPRNWGNLKKLVGCVRLLNSPITCDDLWNFFFRTRVTCHYFHSTYYDNPHLTKCSKRISVKWLHFAYTGIVQTSSTTTTTTPTTPTTTTTTTTTTAPTTPTTTTTTTTTKAPTTTTTTSTTTPTPPTTTTTTTTAPTTPTTTTTTTTTTTAPKTPTTMTTTTKAPPPTTTPTVSLLTSGVGSDASTSGPKDSGASTSGPKDSDSTISGPESSDASTSGPEGSEASTSGPEGSDAPTAGPSGPEGSHASTSSPEGSHDSTSGPEGSGVSTFGPSGPEGPDAPTSGPVDSGVSISGPVDSGNRILETVAPDNDVDEGSESCSYSTVFSTLLLIVIHTFFL